MDEANVLPTSIGSNAATPCRRGNIPRIVSDVLATTCVHIGEESKRTASGGGTDMTGLSRPGSAMDGIDAGASDVDASADDTLGAGEKGDASTSDCSRPDCADCCC